MTANRLPGEDGRLSPPDGAGTATETRAVQTGEEVQAEAKPSEKKVAQEAEKPKRRWLDTFTKLAVFGILVNAVGWVWCSYGLAYLGRYEIAESLSQTAVEVVLGTFIAYAVKSGVENVSKYGVTLPGAQKDKDKTDTTNLHRDY